MLGQQREEFDVTLLRSFHFVAREVPQNCILCKNISSLQLTSNKGDSYACFVPVRSNAPLLSV